MLTVPAAIILSGATGVAVGVILYENRDILKEQFHMARQKVAMALHELADSIAEEHRQQQQQRYRQRRGRSNSEDDGNYTSEDDEKATSASTTSGHLDTTAARKRIVRRYHDFENDNPEEFGLKEKVEQDLLGDSIENSATVVAPQEEMPLLDTANVDRVILDQGVHEEKIDVVSNVDEGKTEQSLSGKEKESSIDEEDKEQRHEQSGTESGSTDNSSYVMDGFYEEAAAAPPTQQQRNDDYWSRQNVNQWAKQASQGD